MKGTFVTTLAIALLIINSWQACAQYGYKPDPDPRRFQSEIDAFINWDAKNTNPEKPVLFIGSSSIRLWKTHRAFPALQVVNRGFGGAHISDMLYYYNEIVRPYKPQLAVFYCGDNDIADGKPVDQVFEDFKTFMNLLFNDYPEITMIYLPAKPSLKRWEMYPDMHLLNKRIAGLSINEPRLVIIDTATPLLGIDGKPDNTFYSTDSLHLNPEGYRVWNRMIGPALLKLVPKQ
jgi:lysophospholipase L1-like esterase